MGSFNHSTSSHLKIMHIDAKLLLLEHFEKSVKPSKSTYYRPSRRNRLIVSKVPGTYPARARNKTPALAEDYKNGLFRVELLET